MSNFDTLDRSGTVNPNPEDEVSRAAERIVKNAGEAVIEASDGLEAPEIEEGSDVSKYGTRTKTEGGKVTEINEQEWPGMFGGDTTTTRVAKRPSLLRRIFRRPVADPDTHSIRTSEV